MVIIFKNVIALGRMTAILVNEIALESCFENVDVHYCLDVYMSLMKSVGNAHAKKIWLRLLLQWLGCIRFTSMKNLVCKDT